MPGFDIAVIPLATAARKTIVTPSLTPFAGEQGVVSGLAKLVQTVTFLFLTEPGSVIFDETLGASPVNEILRRNNLERDNIEQAVAKSTSSIIGQIQRYNGSDAAADERIKVLKIETLDFDVGTGQVTLQITIESQAGNSAEYAMSLTIPIEI